MTFVTNSRNVASAWVVIFATSFIGCASKEKKSSREGAEQSAEESAGSGEAVYVAYCAACHQEDGGGIGSIFPPLDQSDFLADRERTIDAILNGLQGPIMIDGKEYNGTMPPLPPIYDNESAAAVINYVVDRFGRGSWQTTAEEVSAKRD
jgi:mono/diheme cytochrome c family protein